MKTALLVCLVLLILFAMCFIQIYYFRERKKLQEENKKMEGLLLQTRSRYENVTIQNRMYQQLKHDIKKYEHLLQKLTQTDSVTCGQIFAIIVNDKMQEAKQKGILFLTEGQMTGNLRMDVLEFSSLMMNLLDNAMEASEKTKEGFVKMQIKEDESAGECIILLKNSKREDILFEKNREGNGYVSSKDDKENHGIGTQIIQRIVRENNGEIRYEDGGNCMNILCRLKCEA